MEVPSEIEGIEVVLEMADADESLAVDLRAIFTDEDDDVMSSHAFGGATEVIVLTKLVSSTFEKLSSFWSRLKASTPKTKLKIGKSTFEMSGFTEAEIERLLASPGFQKACRTARAK